MTETVLANREMELAMALGERVGLGEQLMQLLRGIFPIQIAGAERHVRRKDGSGISCREIRNYILKLALLWFGRNEPECNGKKSHCLLDTKSC